MLVFIFLSRNVRGRFVGRKIFNTSCHWTISCSSPPLPSQWRWKLIVTVFELLHVLVPAVNVSLCTKASRSLVVLFLGFFFFPFSRLLSSVQSEIIYGAFLTASELSEAV